MPTTLKELTEKFGLKLSGKVQWGQRINSNSCGLYFVTITNDAWFGPTSAPYQHFSKAVFRAIENRVPVARAANTGISGFIDSRGRILGTSDIFVEAAMTQELTIGNEKSIYTKYGDVFAYLCIISTVLLLAASLYKSRR